MITLENVNYIYNKGRPDETQALFDVNAVIPRGMITAVIGHTGSGKSTLIRLLNGLEKPHSGRIIADGAENAELRFKIGMVFQYPEDQLFCETVEEDIAYGPGNMGLDAEEISSRVKRAAEIVGLDEKHLSSSPWELSGGMKRRAAIAGILAMQPEMIVFDEPAAGLDPEGRRRIFELIRELKQRAMTVVFVSHSMEDVAETADNILVMNEGRAVMSGSPEQIFSRSAELIEMGLDVPEITRLCMRLRKMGMELPENIYTAADAVENIGRILKNA